MSNFSGTVLVTGASAGIGAACARSFAAAGANLVLVARRRERLESLAARLEREHGTRSHLLSLDVRDAGTVTQLLAQLHDAAGDPDVVVNNAGVARGVDPLQDGDVRDWDEMIDTNVKGLLYVTRAVLPGMIDRGRGHIINIGSIAGHQTYPGGGVYSATKHAVNAITRSLRMDLLGTPIRVSTVDPGLVETEFSEVRFRGDSDRAEKVYQGYEPLLPEDIADAVLFCATRPAHVNIDEIILMPTAQASVTMVAREG